MMLKTMQLCVFDYLSISHSCFLLFNIINTTSVEYVTNKLIGDFCTVQ